MKTIIAIITLTTGLQASPALREAMRDAQEHRDRIELDWTRQQEARRHREAMEQRERHHREVVRQRERQHVETGRWWDRPIINRGRGTGQANRNTETNRTK